MIRLILNADDFGQSAVANRNILKAYTEGVLTSTTLIIGAPAAKEALEMAKNHPGLGVGLHLVTVQGQPVLSAKEVPALVSPAGLFPENPVIAGLRYHFSKMARAQLKAEIFAQVERFLETGLKPSHLDSHLQMHVHPAISDIVFECMLKFKIHRLRVPLEPFSFSRSLKSGHLIRNLIYATEFGILAKRLKQKTEQHQFRATDHCYGLMHTGEMDERTTISILECLPSGTHEIYFHPENPAELESLLSPRVRDALAAAHVHRIHYNDL